MLSSGGKLFVWHRQAEKQPEASEEDTFGSEAAQMELRAVLTVPVMQDQAALTHCEVSADASVVSLFNEAVVAAYPNPISFEQGSELVGGEIQNQLGLLLNPNQGCETLPEVFLLTAPKPRTLSNDVLEEAVSSVMVVWKGTPYIERISLLPPLPGETPLEPGAIAPPHLSRWVMTSDVRSCAISKDSLLLAAGLADGCTVLWDVPSGTVKFLLPLHLGAVSFVCLGQEHAVTVGEDKKLRSYSLLTGARLLEVEVPPCGIASLHCLLEAPLALALTSWGLKLIDLQSGSIFADLTTDAPDEVVPDLVRVEVHVGLALTVLALRPADTVDAPEEEPPPPEGEEPEEPAPWRVPIQIDLKRILTAYSEYRVQVALTTTPRGDHEQQEAADLAMREALKPKRGSIAGSVASGRAPRHSVKDPTQSTRQSLNFANVNCWCPFRPSPFDIANPSEYDVIGRVREYGHMRHGERRLRDIRVQKRLATLVESMKQAEAQAHKGHHRAR
eukprot:TRINITY_DN4084_c0_g1_i4.p1 TRINITY_DN4084_c0_g1~~TRINITY_DN4084_c0_g1_i4.p1  ORF type:complete len:502 (+),score=93.19 TRINITY_DN4084_c0_g1_i4:535-2040(+)